MVKKKSNQNLLLGGIGLAALGLLVLSKKEGSATGTPSIIVTSPSVTFPSFDFGGIGAPPLPDVTNVYESFTNNLPDVTQIVPDTGQIDVPTITNPIKTPSSSNLFNWDSILGNVPTISLPDPNTLAGTIPGLFEQLKKKSIEGAYPSGKEGTKLVQESLGKPGIENALIGFSSSAAGTAGTKLGIDLIFQDTPYAFKLGSSGLVTLGEKTPGVLSKVSGVAGPIIGAGGTLFAAGATANAIENVQKKGTPESAGELGATIAGIPSGLIGFIPGVGLPASLAFSALTIPGAYATGYVTQTAINNAKANAPTPGQDFSTFNYNTNTVLPGYKTAQSFKGANPGVVDSSPAVGYPDLTSGDFEANTDMSVNFSSSGGKSKSSVSSQGGSSTSTISVLKNFQFNQALSKYQSSYKSPASSMYSGSFGGLFK